MTSVCVLMSTYNGIKFIKKQLDSILKQKDVDVDILVRDDGSTDGTIEVIESYAVRYQKIRIMESKENLGPAGSFMELLYFSEKYDFYAFADQDDIWKTNKLKRAVEFIGETKEPCLYCSNQIIYIDGKECGLRFNEPPKINLVNSICGNVISGCTMVMNKSLRDILIDERNRPTIKCLKQRMHDTWIIAVAELCGSTFYDHVSYIDYRIHEENAVGLKENRVKRLIKKFISPELRDGRSTISRDLLKFKNIEYEKRRMLSAFSHKNKIGLITNNYIKKNCSENRFLFVLKVIMGWI